MRCLGSIQGQQSAERFVAYLLTIDISTQIDALPDNNDTWEIWVRDEDLLQRARDELTEFQRDPTASRYVEAIPKASQLLEQREKQRQQMAKNVKRVEPAARPGFTSGKIPPLTLTLLLLSIAVGIVTEFARPTNEFGASVLQRLSFVSPEDILESNGDPAASLKRGQIWRAITPIFIHIGILHLAMNGFMLVSFGRLVERWIGTPKFALMILALAVVPNLLQGLSPEWMRGSYNFGGISGVVYGLFGYVWLRTSINPSHGISIPFPMVVLFVGLIVLGMSGVIPELRLADLAHLGGLMVGAAFGYASEAPSSSS